MRLPRMTTRRWMIVAAAIAMALGGIREVGRLKQRRDTCLIQATWHAEAAAYHRRLSVRLATRTDRQIAADQEPTPSPAPIVEAAKLIEQEFGLSPERSKRADGHELSDGHERFREAEARRYALSDKRSKLVDAYRQKESKNHAKQAEYHAALAHKYRNAARYLWLHIEPDRPEPSL
jgi:hypothetical protein